MEIKKRSHFDDPRYHRPNARQRRRATKTIGWREHIQEARENALIPSKLLNARDMEYDTSPLRRMQRVAAQKVFLLLVTLFI